MNLSELACKSVKRKEWKHSRFRSSAIRPCGAHRNNTAFVALLIISLTGAGCANVRESVLDFPKGIWGSSTRGLEKARGEAIKKTFQCTLDECFDAVITLAQTKVVKPEAEEESGDSEEEETGENLDLLIYTKSDAVLDLFIRNRKKWHIVVMGVPGSINTTEVGIFFDSVSEGKVQVDIASLSKNAKITVSEIIFEELDKHYQDASP